VAKGFFGAMAASAAAQKELDLVSKISRLRQGIKASDAALKKNLINDELWTDLCLARSQVSLELGNAYHSQDDGDELKKSFIDARDCAVKARTAYAAKAPTAKKTDKKSADILLALANALEDLAQFARLLPAQNYEEAATTFDQAGLLHSDYAYNAGRARFRWAVYLSPPLDEKKKKELFNSALKSLGPAARDEKHPHAVEASYWEGMSSWYLADFNKAIQSFERCIALGRDKASAFKWVQWSIDGVVGVTRKRVKDQPANIIQWVDEAERIYLPLKDRPVAQGYEEPFNDLSAESQFKQANDLAAKKQLLPKEVAKLQSLLNKAFELKHSDGAKSIEIATARAYGLKANKLQLQLSLRQVTEIYEQTIATINSAPNLNDSQKQKERNVFESNWKKIP